MARAKRPPGADLARHLRTQGITDERVLEAIAQVPRVRFLPPARRHLAAEDRAIEIGLEQTISQPYIVGLMTQELRLSGPERVLEVGTGSGYQAAILAKLVASVWTIERHELLSLRARAVLDGLGYENIHFTVGDGTLGWPERAPFDRVIVTAGAPGLPAALFEQLAEEGLIVAPIGDGEKQVLTITRKHRNKAQIIESIPCRFVPLVGEQGWPEAR